ncbi:hypothetical protein NP569_25070, partial [Vibrio parahaemolyticus]|nr:hypothetical protein [Vibrio parahaemolyticus]
ENLLSAHSSGGVVSHAPCHSLLSVFHISFSSAEMKHPLCSLLSLITFRCFGSIGLAEQLTNENLTTSFLPANFHKENTVTNDWIPEGEED